MQKKNNGKTFYTIMPNDDGTVDVYLALHSENYPTEDGLTEHDATFSVVRGVVPWEGLYEEVRHNYYAWCEAGEKVVV